MPTGKSLVCGAFCQKKKGVDAGKFVQTLKSTNHNVTAVLRDNGHEKRGLPMAKWALKGVQLRGGSTIETLQVILIKGILLQS